MKKMITNMKTSIADKPSPETGENKIKRICYQVDHQTGTWNTGKTDGKPEEMFRNKEIPLAVLEQIVVGEAIVKYKALSKEEAEYRRNTHPRHWYPTDAPCGRGYIQAVEKYQTHQIEIFLVKAGKVILGLLGGVVVIGFLYRQYRNK